LDQGPDGTRKKELGTTSLSFHELKPSNESAGAHERNFKERYMIRSQMAELRRCGLTRFPALQALVLVSLILAPFVAAAQDAASRPVGGEELRSSGNGSDAPRRADPGGRDEVPDALCLMVESAAKANDLPLEFFTRVIWQESHFRAEAIGPVTRSGQRARGIAQFMPGTASERGLLDPFNPVQALPKAAEFLAELRNQFGNLGLAAAAYNAGPRRVRDWLAGSGEMPAETRNYVLAITGHGLENWVATGKSGKSYEGETKACHELVTLLRQEPNQFVSRLTQSVTLAIAKPWGIQMATGFNRNQALTAYANIVKDLGSVIGQQGDPTRQPILVRSHGTSSFYQVRIGANTRREADDLCKAIRRAHAACLVKRRGA
jgi:hypothetical protein